MELVVAPAAADDTGLIQRMLRLAKPGDTVLVTDGVYPRQLITGRTFPQRVTVRGQSRDRTVLDSMALVDVRGVTVENLTIRPAPSSFGITVHGGGQLAFRRLIIDGAATATTQGRGIAVFGDSDDPAKWPADIIIERCAISGFAADLIDIFGAREILVRRCALYDVQLNDDHNDGVQVTAADGFEVAENLIWCRPQAIVSTPPDQAIIASTTGAQKISGGVIAGNRIRNWPGTAIIVAGAGISDVKVFGNECLAARGGVVIGAVGPEVDAWANTFVSTGPAAPFDLALFAG